MKYLITQKKLLKFLEDEIKTSEISFSLNIPLEFSSNHIFTTLGSAFSKQISRYFLNLQNPTTDIENAIPSNFSDFPEEIVSKLNDYFQSYKNAFEYIELNKLSSAKTRNYLNSLHIIDGQQLFFHSDFDIKELKAFFKYIDSPKQIYLLKKINDNLYEDNTIELDFGDENGTPEHCITSEESLINIACLHKRFGYQDVAITVDTQSPEKVVSALFPSSSKLTQSFYDLPFSFKNEDFLNTSNENILEDLFIQVANMEIIVPNLQSYMEELEELIEEYGSDIYFKSCKNILQDRVADHPMSKFLGEFYRFLETIPKDIIDDIDNLQKISDLLNQPSKALGGYPLVPPYRRVLGTSSSPNIKAIEVLAFANTPISLFNLSFYIPEFSTIQDTYKYGDIVGATTSTQTIQNHHNKSYQDRDYQEKVFNRILAHLEKNPEAENKLFNNNHTVIKTIFKNQDVFSSLDFQEIKNKQPQLIELIADYYDLFTPEIWNDPIIKSTIFEKILNSQDAIEKSIANNQSSNYSNNQFINFVKQLNLDDVNLLLDTFRTKFIDDEKFKTLFTNVSNNDDKDFAFPKNDKNIIHQLVGLKRNFLALQLIDNLHIYQEALKVESSEQQLQELKENAQSSFLIYNDFILKTGMDSISIFSSTQNSFARGGNSHSTLFSYVQETLIMKVLDVNMFDNISFNLINAIFQVDNAYNRCRTLQSTPDEIYEHYHFLAKNNNKIATQFLSFIHMDELMKNSKVDFTTTKWFDFIAKKVNGNDFETIQHLVTQSKDDLAKLHQCKTLMTEKFNLEKFVYQIGSFKMNARTLQSLWKKTSFEEFVLPLYILSSDVIKKSPDEIKSNPSFWKKIIKDTSYDLNSYNQRAILKAIQEIHPSLLKDNDLVFDLYQLYQKCSINNNSYNGYHFNTIKEVSKNIFSKPKYILKLAKEIEDGNIKMSDIQQVNPNLYNFIEINKISRPDLYNTLQVIFQQSILEQDTQNLDNNSTPKSKGLKF